MRGFIALDVPDEVRLEIHNHYAEIPEIRRGSAEKIHITLFFFGNLLEPEVKTTIHVMEETDASQFTISVGGLDTFSPRRPRVVFNNIIEGSPRIVRIHDELLRRMSAAGMAVEVGELHPHLTFGRVPRMNRDVYSKVIRYISENNSHPIDVSFKCSSMSLTKSVQGKAGMVYTKLYTRQFV